MPVNNREPHLKHRNRTYYAAGGLDYNKHIGHSQIVLLTLAKSYGRGIFTPIFSFRIFPWARLSELADCLRGMSDANLLLYDELA